MSKRQQEVQSTSRKPFTQRVFKLGSRYIRGAGIISMVSTLPVHKKDDGSVLEWVVNLTEEGAGFPEDRKWCSIWCTKEEVKGLLKALREEAE